ncbi:MAG: histidinol-phosphate aminotransferase family protein, partial [Herminiimonas sp.]|nr:histidinol-phosphate aminotransferase family protein [Herminiimonas sp.]
LGFHALPTAGNFVHIDFGDKGQSIHPALREKVYYRADFDHPCLAGYSRFTVAPRPVMRQVVDLIQHAVKTNL